MCAPARRFFNESMKTKLHSLFIGLALLAGVHEVAGLAATNTPAAIPWNQIGAKAGADYTGDGLAVSPTAQGARLHCVFQRLEGEATPEGLWLTSTVTNAVKDRFRVTAAEIGRVTGPGAADRTSNIQHPTTNIQLQDTGIISLAGQTVRFSRPGLVEEYSVSMDGVRQDFLVPERPAGAGELAVRSGRERRAGRAGGCWRPVGAGSLRAQARLQPLAGDGCDGPRAGRADGSGVKFRKQKAESRNEPAPPHVGGYPLGMPDSALVVVVNDAEAVYPVRIDPTFSDANWISMGGVPGVHGRDLRDGSGWCGQSLYRRRFHHRE